MDCTNALCSEGKIDSDYVKIHGSEGYCEKCLKNIWKLEQIIKMIGQERAKSPDGKTAWDRVEDYRLKHGHLPGENEPILNEEVQRRATQEAMNKIAQVVSAMLPKDWGFFLLAAPYGQPDGKSRCNYVSTMDRKCSINTMKEWLIKASGEEEWMKHLD